MQTYDLIIIGGGPAGLAAGIYGARAKLKTAILEKGAVGGMAFTTREIVNYPGFFKDTTGPDLMKTMANHAIEFGAEIIKEQITEVEFNGDIKVIKTKKGKEYKAKAVILAPGSQPRMLNIPGEVKFRGSGVSYCATCDADFYEGLTVVVVGNGDAAIEEANYITKYASKVIVIVIHDEGILDCNKASAEKAFANKKVEFIWNSVLTEIQGDESANAVAVKNLKTGMVSELKADGVFIYVGMVPNTQFLKGKVDLDERGYIKATEMMETSVDGVYAVGDARVKYLRQVVTAVADGATATVAAERYLIEEDDFKENVLNANKPVILAFWNPMDEKSIFTVAELEKAVCQKGDKVALVKVDMSRKKRIAQRYSVTSSPTVLLIKEGQVVRVLSDKLNTDSLNIELGI